MYGGISGFMALYLNVTTNVDANDSKHLFTCWSVPGLSSSRRCLFMAFARFKISVGANIHKLHEVVLGWTDVLNFSDVHFTGLFWLAVLVSCSEGNAYLHRGHEDFHRCFPPQLCLTFHTDVSISTWHVKVLGKVKVLLHLDIPETSMTFEKSILAL